MKDKFRRLAALVLFAMALSGAALAQGYEHQVRADIPFNFYAGGKLVQAGTYIFAVNVGNHNVEMVSREKVAGSFLPGSPNDGTANGLAVLTFRTNGSDLYVLQKVQWPDFGVSFNIQTTLSDVGEVRPVNATQTVVAALLR